MVTYLPYDALNVQWLSKKDEFILSLPWLSLEIKVNEAEKGWVQQAILDLKENPESKYAQKFLGTFKEHPIAYIAPRNSEAFSDIGAELDKTDIKVLLDFSSPFSLATCVNEKAAQEVEFCLPQQWQWSFEEILTRSKINETEAYDPLTIVTLLIGKRLEQESKTQNEREKLPQHLENLRLKDEAAFFEAMKKLLRQTHYITSRLQECASPALHTFEPAAHEILAFMDEEKGHDRLMESSLAELGCTNPKELEPFPAMVLLMDLFKQASHICPLAFTLMVGFFEGSSYGDSDPLADILAKSSKPKAARGYAIHFEINKQSRHCDIILNLAQQLDLQNKEEIRVAVCFLELATLLGNQADIKAVTL